MGAYLDRMPAGIPGEVSRKAGATLEPGVVGNTFISYGAPVKIVSGKFAPLAAGDSAADVYGFLARPFTTTRKNDDGLDGAASGTQRDVLRRGYMTVKLAQGDSVMNGIVQVRVQAEAGKAVGDLEAATGSGLVPVPATFMGEKDGQGNVEIACNI